MDIGIKKTRMGINLAFILIFISLAIVCAIMWACYQGNFVKENIIKNGIEVDAKCVSYFRRLEDGDMHQVIFWCKYEYVSADGKEYYTYRRYERESDALVQVGKIIPVVIDPYGTDIWDCDMNFINNLKLTYERDLILAIVFCITGKIALYILIYRGIYRSAMNYKIRKKVGFEENDYICGSKTNNNAIKTGGVTKVRKWLVCYVKV